MTAEELVRLSKSKDFLSNLSKINRWDLLPALFRVKGKPFSLEGRDQFSVLFGQEIVRETIIMSGRQLGKCYRVSGNNLRDCYGAPLSNPQIGDKVLAFDGWKAVPAVISNVFHPGTKKILRISTRNGNELFVSPDHKIKQIDGFTPASELKVGSRIASIRRGGVFGDFKPDPGKIEAAAYTIGNGCCTTEKLIPDWVFRLSRDDTVLFMSRLWATNGRVACDHRGFLDISYCTASRELCRGVRALLFKLGFMNSMRVRKTRCKSSGGHRVQCIDSFVVRVETHASQTAFMEEVKVPGCNAVVTWDAHGNSDREALPVSLRDGDAYFDSVESIEELPEEECLDLEIRDHHNFMLDNICVHNSMSLSRSEGYDLASVNNLQILYVAPLQEQTRRYSDLYFSETIRSCPLLQTLQKPAMLNVLDSDTKIIKATGHQSFANGAGIQFTYAKDSGDRIRGVMADRIDFDEVQDQSAEVIPIVQESLTSSEWGCSRYTGTAKVEENLIETKWRQSSMCEWVMKCEHCGTWAIPNLDGDVLRMIQADGIHCLHCGKRLNVLNGKWIAAYPDKMNSFRGYHIPQVICPFIVNNKNNWDKLLHKLLNGVLSTFIQENLGISYSVGQRLITMKHLLRQCVLPSAKTLQDEIKRNPARYSCIVGGLDWGGAELSSFTVLTIIGIRPNGRIDVLWAERYRGFDPDEQMMNIAKACTFYGVTAIGADIGMGLDKNILLAKRFGLPIVQIQYTRQLKLFGKNQSKGRTNTVQCWTVDKVLALDTLFIAIRNRRIFFPKDEAFRSKFLPDILSPYESTSESGGLTHRLYLRSESQPDDFCHALCFASMVAMRLIGMAVDDMIPMEAFGGGRVADEAPDNYGVSTAEE